MSDETIGLTVRFKDNDIHFDSSNEVDQFLSSLLEYRSELALLNYEVDSERFINEIQSLIDVYNSFTEYESKLFLVYGYTSEIH